MASRLWGRVARGPAMLDSDLLQQARPRSPIDAPKTSVAPERHAAGKAAILVERLSVGLALLVVVLAPLPFGSVETPWIALWCALMALSLLTADYGDAAPGLRRVLASVLLAYVAVLGVVALQLAGWGAPDPVREEAARLLRAPLPLNTGPAPTLALIALGPSLLAVMTFVRVALFARRAGRATLALHVVGVSGLIYAIVSGLGLLIDPTALLWREKTAYLGNLTGTFVNRNTAATFFGTAALIWWLRLLTATLDQRFRGLHTRDFIWLLLAGREMGLVALAACTAISVAACAATGSRAGFLLTLVALAASWLMLRPFSPAAALKSRLSWIALGVALVVVEIFGDAVGARIHKVGLESEGRFIVHAATLKLAAEHLWLGIGIGQFEHVFPSIRPDTIATIGLWDRAHSTPIEVLVELGLPAFVVIAAVWCAVLFSLWRGAFICRDPVLVAAAAVGLLGTAHAFVDFSLQIPGYMVVFACVLGAGVGRLHGEAPTLGRHRARQSGWRGLLRVLSRR